MKFTILTALGTIALTQCGIDHRPKHEYRVAGPCTVGDVYGASATNPDSYACVPAEWSVMMFDGYRWRKEGGPTGINDDIPLITREWHDWHGDLACAFIQADQTVDDMKVGQCAFLWVVLRDSNGDYLAFRPETVRPVANKLFHDHLIQMRDDGLHVWLRPGEEIQKADKPIWRAVFKPIRAHVHSKLGSYYSGSNE